MGTDIHFHAEEWNGKEWRPLDWPIETCWGCDGSGKRGGKDCPQCCWTTPYAYDANRKVSPGKRREPWYSDRNYDVFAVLANVRNGRGFAGVYTGEPVTPISEPRGLPEDLSYELQEELGEDSYYHSATWLDLDEVLNYPWETTRRKYGVVTPAEFKKYLEDGHPDSWCGSVSGGGVQMISNEEMESRLPELLKNNKGPFGASHYTAIEWNETIAESAGNFLERMKTLRALTEGKKVRLVFAFDS